MKKFFQIALFLVALVSTSYAPRPISAAPVAHVVQISVDAMGAKYLEKFLAEAPAEFPNFGRFVKEGATTFDARTDFTHTITLPNHTCMITGRPVKTPTNWPIAIGHGWTNNGNFPDPKIPPSLHATNMGGANQYTASTFDVAHDAGLKTALYSGKSKFALFITSYNEKFGTPNAHGKNKVDRALLTSPIGAPAIADMKTWAPNYVFLHFGEPDVAGHAYGYLGQEYRDSVKEVDAQLGELFKFVETDPEWKSRTDIILSADHGGEPGTKGHGNASHPYDYTIPFFVWGPDAKAGADLYALNPQSRVNPGDGRPEYAPTGQPIRNGDGGNLALKLLGLPAIPGSHINNAQDLAVR